VVYLLHSWQQCKLGPTASARSEGYGQTIWILVRANSTVGGADPFQSYSYLATLTNTWGIDGSIVRFSSWGNYFVWSCMSNNLQSLCIASLTSPGKIGATKVLSQPTQSWEKNGSPVMEGPAAMYHGGKTYLTYSASYCWTPNYSLGLLTWNGSGDPSLSASWAKSGPVLTSANSNYGPGHNG
jgi:GH43 family beta-xylosidase